MASFTEKFPQLDVKLTGIISSFIEIDVRMQLVNLTIAYDMWLHFQGFYQ